MRNAHLNEMMSAAVAARFVDTPSVYEHWRDSLAGEEMPTGGYVKPILFTNQKWGIIDYSGYGVGDVVFLSPREALAAMWVLAAANKKVYITKMIPEGIEEAVYDKFKDLIDDGGFRRRFSEFVQPQ